jgi:hypothetical protein
MSQVEQSDIKYCPDCTCMIEEWWNYCAICGSHTASNDQQRTETAARSVAKQPLSWLLWKSPGRIDQNYPAFPNDPSGKVI